ncbi:hypothetical protein [Streptococcus pseudopneumoniae]|uniref:hypothetical protein n=1 Tax=Streptococcus pseudopneumoniae TaxID=257758 RepID=UPI001AAE32F3|nr:hypothetical protein [Streptococcus pseudopneumoniae]
MEPKRHASVFALVSLSFISPLAFIYLQEFWRDFGYDVAVGLSLCFFPIFIWAFMGLAMDDVYHA